MQQHTCPVRQMPRPAPLHSLLLTTTPNFRQQRRRRASPSWILLALRQALSLLDAACMHACMPLECGLESPSGGASGSLCPTCPAHARARAGRPPQPRAGPRPCRSPRAPQCPSWRSCKSAQRQTQEKPCNCSFPATEDPIALRSRHACPSPRVVQQPRSGGAQDGAC